MDLGTAIGLIVGFILSIFVILPSVRSCNTKISAEHEQYCLRQREECLRDGVKRFECKRMLGEDHCYFKDWPW